MTSIRRPGRRSLLSPKLSLQVTEVGDTEDIADVEAPEGYLAGERV
jgi:hypothetical protein